MNQQLVIISEQHTLTPEQLGLLCENHTVLKVPASGWSLDEMAELSIRLQRSALERHDETGERTQIVFVSPIPWLLMDLSRFEGFTREDGFSPLEVKVFHNDSREKKELPGGRIVFTVSRTGWALLLMLMTDYPTDPWIVRLTHHP